MQVENIDKSDPIQMLNEMPNIMYFQLASGRWKRSSENFVTQKKLSRPWPVFRECHRDRIVCMSLIVNPDVKITSGESLLRIFAGYTDGFRMLSRS